MSQTDRLAYYFRDIGPEKIVTQKEIYNLLWLNDIDGGPLNVSNSIRQIIYRVKRKYGYDFDCIKKFGYRMKDPHNGQMQA